MNARSKKINSSQWYVTITDSFESNLYKQPPTKDRKKAPENIYKMNFCSKESITYQFTSVI